MPRKKTLQGPVNKSFLYFDSVPLSNGSAKLLSRPMMMYDLENRLLERLSVYVAIPSGRQYISERIKKLLWSMQVQLFINNKIYINLNGHCFIQDYKLRHNKILLTSYQKYKMLIPIKLQPGVRMQVKINWIPLPVKTLRLYCSVEGRVFDKK